MRKYFSLRRMRGNSFLWGPSPLVGILAAIAIPAYHDYTLRAKVTEGLNQAGAVKAAVAEFYATEGKWPRDLRELKFESVPRSRYVTFVAVNRGTVVIRYSQTAGALLARQHLTLRPTVTPQGDVVWGCGYMPSAGVDPKSGAAPEMPTSLKPKYLPKLCRGA
jgi:type IV pilus assembly protein PilA